MSMKKKQKHYLFILASTFVTVVFWIGFSIYHTWVTSTISPDLAIQIQPITPNFESAVIEKLKTREKVAPLYDLPDTGEVKTTAIQSSPVSTTSATASSSARQPVNPGG